MKAWWFALLAASLAMGSIAGHLLSSAWGSFTPGNLVGLGFVILASMAVGIAVQELTRR